MSDIQHETNAPVEASTTTEQPVSMPEQATAAPVTETAANEEVAMTEALATEPLIESGFISYKAPGVLKFKFSKRYFWLGEEAVSHEQLSSYLRGEKPEVAHSTAAWSSQTGKGLLYFSKSIEEKNQPIGVLNLAEASELEQTTLVEFTLRLHGQKHSFRTQTSDERVGWALVIEKAMREAQAAKEGIHNSAGYKQSLASLGQPATIAGGAAGAATTTSKRSVEEADRNDSGARTGSFGVSSEDDVVVKTGKSKSRSMSRGKRSVSRGKRNSIFGKFMNKEEDHEAKKEIGQEGTSEVGAGSTVAEMEGASVPAVASLYDPESIAARVLGAPVVGEGAVPTTETAPVVESSVETPRIMEKPRPSKRNSIFGFLEKVRSPAAEKKESEVMQMPETGVIATPTITEPVADKAVESSQANEPILAGTATEAVTVPETLNTTEEPVTTARPTMTTKRSSFLGSFVNRVRSKSPANQRGISKTEELPTTTVAPTTTEEPLAETTVAPTSTEMPVDSAAAPVAISAEEPITEMSTTATTPKENRRKSYFGTFSDRVESLFRKQGQTAQDKEVAKENTIPATTEKVEEEPVLAEATAATTTEAPATEKAVETSEQPSTATAVPESVTTEHTHANSSVISAAA